MADRDRHVGRKVALVGGVALAAWLLLRGKGWSLGTSGGLGLGTSGDATSQTPRAPCRVFVRADRVELDGAPASVETVVARCRERGRAEVNASGAAIVRSIVEILRALQAAGVVIHAPPDVAHFIPMETAR